MAGKNTMQIKKIRLSPTKSQEVLLCTIHRFNMFYSFIVARLIQNLLEKSSEPQNVFKILSLEEFPPELLKGNFKDVPKTSREFFEHLLWKDFSEWVAKEEEPGVLGEVPLLTGCHFSNTILEDIVIKKSPVVSKLTIEFKFNHKFKLPHSIVGIKYRGWIPKEIENPKIMLLDEKYWLVVHYDPARSCEPIGNTAA